ncbi:hypothetical protein Pmani_019419 [Petrolisthes manimaculis]|uniref:Uncharacterized protein n=1 Tax=Petrolisthes manimaculis TaxID=1843537 RepID=A0AAE1PHS0_9EUCA|nr:hypothetical protein Pmani_019419 [Petrolisthes manimaculis]
MVVCPCGVMGPATGGGSTGRIRRAVRTPSCFHSGETVTSQPRDLQEPASVEKLTAATNNTTISTTTSTTTRLTTPAVHIQQQHHNNNKNNKGGVSVGVVGIGGRQQPQQHQQTSIVGDDVLGKGDPNSSSRTTLALATRESGRYVGTRPLKSNNKSPTPTITTNTTNKQTTVVVPAGSSRGSKHLPAVRTSPAVVVSPLDNNKQQTPTSTTTTTPTAPQPPTSRLKTPIALPRKVPVTQRINELNVANQKR